MINLEPLAHTNKLAKHKIPYLDTKKDKWSYKEFDYDGLRALIISNLKEIKDYKFDKRIVHAKVPNITFKKEGAYFSGKRNTKEYYAYWDKQQEYCLNGMIIDNWYINPNLYFYINFVFIPIKMGVDGTTGTTSLPDFRALDYYVFLKDMLDEMDSKHTIWLKGRQLGFTIKFLVPIIRMLWFVDGKGLKYLVPKDTILTDTWQKLLEPIRVNLNKHTAWYREFEPKKSTGLWKQTQTIRDEDDGKEYVIGTQSTLNGYITSQSASSSVGGTNHYVLIDEAGKHKNLISLVKYLKPSVEAGKYVTGYYKIVGAAGEEQESRDFQEMFNSPGIYGCSSQVDTFNHTNDEIGMFVPSTWAMEGYIDEYGNTDVEGATKYRLQQRELLKNNAKALALEISQYPLTPHEAFSHVSEENPFNKDIIQPHYDRLRVKTSAYPVTLKEKNGNIYHEIGSFEPEVLVFPVNNTTDKRGCVMMVEPPIPNAPHNIYYAGVDTVTQIKTTTSLSLQSIYIYRADYYRDNVLVKGKAVAWYCGRFDNVDITYNICMQLIEYYNAKAMIENDMSHFIQWMIKGHKAHYMMKRSEYPKIQEMIRNSSVHEDFGIRKGNSKTFETHLIDTVATYMSEVIATEFTSDGEAINIYGVERIDDIMLLKECLEYNASKNVDRIWAFAYAVDCAQGNTIRQNVQKITSKKNNESLSMNFRFNPQESIARMKSKGNTGYSFYHKLLKR
jgi:hypothetical protein